jgi:hypothetical protein
MQSLCVAVGDCLFPRREHEVEERSETAPEHPKTAAEASRSGRLFAGIHIDNNNMDAGEFLFWFNNSF